MRSGEKVFTIGGMGVRNVITDVELKPDVYCVRTLATRGSQRHNDFWASYDLSGDPPQAQVCLPYNDVEIELGDARKR